MQNTHKQSSGADQKQLPGLPGKRTWTSWALLSVLGLAAATLTSCAGKYTGSGSIPSVAGAPNQATLAFNVQTDGDTDGDGVAENVKGQIQFQDLAAGVRIHGEILNSGTLPEGPIYIGTSKLNRVEFGLNPFMVAVSKVFSKLQNVGRILST